VELHLLSLGRRERTRLEQDRVADADLAEIVEKESVLELGIRGQLGSGALRQRERERRDALRVASRLIVTKLERCRERNDGGVIGVREPRESVLGAPPLGAFLGVQVAQLGGIPQGLSVCQLFVDPDLLRGPSWTPSRISAPARVVLSGELQPTCRRRSISPRSSSGLNGFVRNVSAPSDVASAR
jgi:hypothetical protein